MKKICLLLCLVLVAALFVGCAKGENDSVPPVAAVPEGLAAVLQPEVCALFGQSRLDIRPQYRMETSERDSSFWYSGLGLLEDGSEGNLFISYNVDGMRYDGLCDYVSGELELVSVFPKGMTFAEFEDAVSSFAAFDEELEGYRAGDYVLYPEADSEDDSVVARLTVKVE